MASHFRNATTSPTPLRWCCTPRCSWPATSRSSCRYFRTSKTRSGERTSKVSATFSWAAFRSATFETMMLVWSCIDVVNSLHAAQLCSSEEALFSNFVCFLLVFRPPLRTHLFCPDNLIPNTERRMVNSHSDRSIVKFAQLTKVEIYA